MIQQAKVSQQAYQTTLTQCFNPPVAAVPASAFLGYRVIKIDDQQ
jgi:hypothetical protein